ncbi:aminotransferase class I/II-fold pyridoxal phosphate-dependent enzyme [Bathymodiolus septemdierum thioautotrophic gill symbiont]|uniref:8-amino-7-oxononanoate synthase n=1 Tax=endosymbiont of Bathymodiolus septemdierum str. Myojin knoll TaxID=1303921 RepID=A0A0N7KBJ7_9GAMM|nr:8-amino-7-oxononanoate synthase [Bathymodiolus septemdierum thioautotrophic gill symbiont]BAS68207.1 8-amino-7-oxononanoate synthase [endosymbiont of Bathymodiolus septemdierum str. Myojin knoll]
MNFTQQLTHIKNQHLYRQVKIADGSCVDFCSNDYLGLKNHPKVIKAFKQGVDKFGVGSGASHLINGHTTAHQELEEALSDYIGVEKTLLFSTGYMANIGVFSALKSELDWVLQDKLNHASLIDANHLIGLPLKRYLHTDIASLEKKIDRQTGQGLIVTDTVFSMDGDQADIIALEKVAKKSDALLMQDDAHGFGIFDTNIPKNSIYMATLGKAAGVMGAFVGGNIDFIDFLVQKSRPYIYTTAIAPALCVATLQSLELIKSGEQRAKLLENIDFFQKFSHSLSLPILPSDSAIQPLIIGDNKQALLLSQTLLEKGFQVSAIRTPTVAKNAERLRITLNANHTQKQIEQLLSEVKYAL